ncbi:MAG: GGDEF domain-containing protein [Aquabacterium sp.]|uniref:GGDEF domain-containing protein n=1 Tax=Aquabacterium sp. TaxID=1872578 RepID=UPI003BD42F56
MPSSNGPQSSSTPSPAQLAKAALRRLAEQRLEPTPDNYRKAYDAEAGMSSSPPAKEPEPTPAPSDDGERWSTLITRLLRGAERGGRQWTTARKKDSLQRVLEGSKSSATRLHQRLSQLVQSWDSDTLDSTLLEGGNENTVAEDSAETAVAPAMSVAPSTDAVATVDATPVQNDVTWPGMAVHCVTSLQDTVMVALPPDQAQSDEAGRALQAALTKGQALNLPEAAHEQVRQEITQACDQARRVIEHRLHLVSQLTELVHSLTDSLADLAEDDSWVQGQTQAMRHQLQEGLHNRGVRHMQQLLSDTRARQLALKRERETARLALKQLIHQMLQQIAVLGNTTDRFQSKLGVYAETIGAADSLESLTGIVREMVEESRAVQSVVAETQTRLQDEHTRASELTERVRHLEDEIRKLSDEVSTDPLTQIANRRGLMRAFEAEQARVDRNSAPLAVGLLDVDNFKRLNDQLGHQTGDEALKFLARRVTECLRPVDVVARYGGEEFVVLLPETPIEEAQQVLTRLQRTLSAEFFTHDDRKVFITFSAGVTPYRQGEPIEATLDRADVALYEAKRTGKNRTCVN